MKKKYRQAAPSWLKLDNAAKIYPAARSRGWAAMFRLSVTLREPVDTAALEKALKSTLARLPAFACKLRAGVFWYYLERMEGAPDIQPDVGNPLVRMNLRENKRFLFRVRVHQSRIAVEFFHALTDGTGGMCFLKTLTAEYLRVKYGAHIPRAGDILDCQRRPNEAEWEDSFLKYARETRRPRGEQAAYRVPGTPEERDFLNITTGIIDAAALTRKSRELGATVTVLLAALLIDAISRVQRLEPSKRKKRMPVKVSVPVNLRRFYPTQTLRNFSSYINPGVQSAYGEHSLEDILTQVKHYIGMEAQEKPLNARWSGNVLDERNRLVRVMPLFIKVLTLKAFFRAQGDRYYSTTLSNLGLVTLPPEMARYVARFDFILGPPSVNPLNCACVGYDGMIYINMSRTVREPVVERLFFTSLVKMGVPVKIESNQRDEC